LLQAVEQTILPPNFGNRLYQTCFLRSQDVSEYDTNDDKIPMEGDDDYTRVAKLEAFFDALSNCTRRGAKNTLKVLMACCQQHPAPAADTSTSTSTDNGFANAKTKTLIEPLEFVNIGYRVALASAFLSSTEHSKDEHQDVGRFLPDKDASEHPGLVALSNSLVDLATKRKQRKERSSTPTTEKVQLVDEHDIQEWAEHVAPLFASCLATFMHTIFFPDRPNPPSRTSFEYPELSGFDSTFFPQGNSPLLFSFGCMSSSLSGEVSKRKCIPILHHPLCVFPSHACCSFTVCILRLRMVCRSIDYKMPCLDTVDRPC
jgi:hypothetical protein